MDANDLDALKAIAAVAPESNDDRYAPKSNARMAAAAQHVIAHDEAFPVGTIPGFALIASAVMDLLHLADKIEPGSAGDLLRHVRDLDSDSGDELGLGPVLRS